MRVVTGTAIRDVDITEFLAWRNSFREATLDLGTGDGHYVQWLARRHPSHAVVGVDLCCANLKRVSRLAPSNAMFIIADATELPAALHGVANRLTINFPWGSLLRGLLEGHPGLLAGLSISAGEKATVHIRLNAGALAEVGWRTQAGSDRIAVMLRDAGYLVAPPSLLGPADLRHVPTTWAKRLAFGRAPVALSLTAVRANPPPCSSMRLT